MKICLNCGEPSQNSYCDEHLLEVRKAQRPKKTSSTARGYGSRWARLSRKARKLQPFCTDCGSTQDLQLDHTEETWWRHFNGKPIGLEHTGGVVCAPCNVARGQARPGGGGSPDTRPRLGPVGQITDSFSLGSQQGGS